MCNHNRTRVMDGFKVCLECGECSDEIEFFHGKDSYFFDCSHVMPDNRNIFTIKEEINKFSNLMNVNILTSKFDIMSGMNVSSDLVFDIDKMFRENLIYERFGEKRIPILIHICLMFIYKRMEYRRIIMRTYKVNGLKHNREKERLRSSFLEIRPFLIEMRETYNPYNHKLDYEVVKKIKDRIKKLSEGGCKVAERHLWLSAYWCLDPKKSTEFKKENGIEGFHNLSRVFFLDLIRDDRISQIPYNYHIHGLRFLKRAGWKGLPKIDL